MSTQEFQDRVIALLDRLDTRLETLERSERQIRSELAERARKDTEHDNALARHDGAFRTTEIAKATLTITGGALAYGVHLILQWVSR